MISNCAVAFRFRYGAVLNEDGAKTAKMVPANLKIGKLYAKLRI